MSVYHHIDPLEQRALALPRMRPMLEALAEKHANLFPHARAGLVRAAMKSRPTTKELPIDEAVNAGFITAEDFRSNLGYKIALTDKGYQAINQQRPFWEGAA